MVICGIWGFWLVHHFNTMYVGSPTVLYLLAPWPLHSGPTLASFGLDLHRRLCLRLLPRHVESLALLYFYYVFYRHLLLSILGKPGWLYTRPPYRIQLFIGVLFSRSTCRYISLYIDLYNYHTLYTPYIFLQLIYKPTLWLYPQRGQLIAATPYSVPSCMIVKSPQNWGIVGVYILRSARSFQFSISMSIIQHIASRNPS